MPLSSAHRATQWVQKPGAHRRAHVANGHDEATRGTLKVGIVGKGEVCLGHADGQVVVALRLVPVDLGLRFRCTQRGIIR